MKQLFSALVLVSMLAACGDASHSEAPATSTPVQEQPATTASTDTSAAQQTAAVYECPMKCEGKTYDKPGKCGKCGMDLVEVKK